MFSRSLNKKEIKLLEMIEEFVRDKHAESEGHDYSHVLQVAKNAIKIAKKVPDQVDPFVLICGALFHDLGRVDQLSGILHGLRGAALVEQFLKATEIDAETGKRIVRIVTRHTSTSHIPPETMEEKIVYDADTLDRFGWVGLLRGIIGKKGSLEDIIEKVIIRRSEDYNKLIFKESREIGREAHEETLFFVQKLKRDIGNRLKGVKEIPFPRPNLTKVKVEDE
ncbi:HD domain-containing protein [Candidatus Aerophobetes bacterium]|nr:HD domain-containing protein [Candidatus Aerophobetes bacterium]